MQDRLDKLIMNAEVICDNSQDPEEISQIKGNVNTLSEQINIIKTWIDEKKQQVRKTYIFHVRGVGFIFIY